MAELTKPVRGRLEVPKQWAQRGMLGGPGLQGVLPNTDPQIQSLCPTLALGVQSP